MVNNIRLNFGYINSTYASDKQCYVTQFYSHLRKEDSCFTVVCQTMANDDIVNQGDEEVCLVYSAEDGFTSFVQALLALFALASLYIKRHQEQPRRKFKTWFLDVSKQGIGAVYAHILNMVIAAIIASNVRGDFELDDQCAWYAINYTIDSTLGLVLSIMFLRLLDYVANKRGWVHLKDSGVYHGDDAIIHWSAQLVVWLIILTVVKIIICYFMWLCSSLLARVGQLFFAPLQANIRAELLFVMIFFPGILNVIYFWIIDSYLKSNKHSKDTHEDFPVEQGENQEEASPYKEISDPLEEENKKRIGSYQNPTLDKKDLV